MGAEGVTMHIHRAHQIPVAMKTAGAARPISAFGLMTMPTSGTPATCSSFGAGEARDAGLFGFVREVVNVLAVFPAGHALVVMPASLPLAYAVRVADKERSHLVLNTEVDDLPCGFVSQITDAPLGSPAVLVLSALQLLPTAGVLRAAALLFGEPAQLPKPLPLEGADAAPGDNQGLARAYRDGSQMDFTQVYCRLGNTRSVVRLGNLDAHMQFKAAIPDQGTRPALWRKRKLQDEGGAPSAHREDHSPVDLPYSLGGPVNGVEAFCAPGILHLHPRVSFAQCASGIDVGEKGAKDSLNRLAMQGKAPLCGPVQFVVGRPACMSKPGGFVHLHAHVPDLRRLLLCCFQFVQLARRQVIEPIHAHGFHKRLFLFFARKAVMCRSEGNASGVAFTPPLERGRSSRSF